MANYVGQKLSRLIRKRAYAAGDRSTLLAGLHELQEQVSTLQIRIANVGSEIAELDKEITRLSAIDPSNIKGISIMPRTIVFKHGTFRREMINYLKSSARPVSTKEILEHMAAQFKIPMETSADRKKARDAIRRPLNHFHEAGAVIRLESGGFPSHGIWCWAEGYVEGDA